MSQAFAMRRLRVRPLPLHFSSFRADQSSARGGRSVRNPNIRRDGHLDSGENAWETIAREGSTGRSWIIFGVLSLFLIGSIFYGTARNRVGPPPKEIAGDALLVQGREVFLDRCVSCHGVSGRGDGPISRGLKGPPPGDLTDREWKHGDKPEQVYEVVCQGVKNTSMPGWLGTLGPERSTAVAAYVYYLAGRNVPEPLRRSSTKSSNMK